MPRLHKALRLSAIACGLLFACRLSDLRGQACQGTLRGFWAERAELLDGDAIGGGGALVGRHFALSASYRHQDFDDDLTGNEALLRAAIVLGKARVQVCPILSIGGSRQEWQPDAAITLTSTRGAGSAGIGAGVELPLVGGLSVLPHVIGQYEYSGTYFKLEGGGADDDESGSTRGRADFEAGLLARFKVIYVGFRAHWSPESKYAYMNRWIAGIAL